MHAAQDYGFRSAPHQPLQGQQGLRCELAEGDCTTLRVGFNNVDLCLSSGRAAPAAPQFPQSCKNWGPTAPKNTRWYVLCQRVPPEPPGPRNEFSDFPQKLLTKLARADIFPYRRVSKGDWHTAGYPHGPFLSGRGVTIDSTYRRAKRLSSGIFPVPLFFS